MDKRALSHAETGVMVATVHRTELDKRNFTYDTPTNQKRTQNVISKYKVIEDRERLNISQCLGIKHKNINKELTKTGQNYQNLEIVVDEVTSNPNNIDNGDSEEGKVLMWNKAFINLRPPPCSLRRKCLRASEKLLNKSCEDILNITGLFMKNLNQKQDDMHFIG